MDRKDQAKYLKPLQKHVDFAGFLAELSPKGMRELMLIKCPSGGWHWTGWT